MHRLFRGLLEAAENMDPRLVASFPPVKRRGAEVKLHALWFDIGRAMMHLFEKDKGRFVPLDEAEVLRLLTPTSAPPTSG